MNTNNLALWISFLSLVLTCVASSSQCSKKDLGLFDDFFLFLSLVFKEVFKQFDATQFHDTVSHARKLLFIIF